MLEWPASGDAQPVPGSGHSRLGRVNTGPRPESRIAGAPASVPSRRVWCQPRCQGASQSDRIVMCSAALEDPAQGIEVSLGSPILIA